MTAAADLARKAAALATAGKDEEAATLYETGLRQFPADARLTNSAGNFHARARRDERAAALFEQALRLDPGLHEAAINLAIVLLRLGRARPAVDILARYEVELSGQARYWIMLGEAAKALGDYDAAERYSTQARIVEPLSKAVQQADARLALERGDAAAVDAYAVALTQDPGNFELMHGYMQALEAAGRLDEALDFGAALAQHFPSWIGGQIALAELRWTSGDRGYADHFAAAAAAHPAVDTYLAWADLLSGNDDHRAAASVLANGLAAFPSDKRLRLAQAVALTEGGDFAGADAVLGTGLQSVEWSLARGRLDIALGKIETAQNRLQARVKEDASDVAAWSLLDLCWRLTDNPNHEWLHGQHGLVREIELPLDTAQFAEVREALRSLHARAAVPLAQSVKGGTQTRGALFARRERALAILKDALGTVLSTYRQGLPPTDRTHPLLAQRNAPWLIAGSWSVRFEASGRHAAHIHPRGLLSSACYFVVPPQVDEPEGPGWLELGRPPPGLAPNLGPLRAIRPRPGTCVLFPSTLFHGTRPISAGERMTVAFDVMPEAG